MNTRELKSHLYDQVARIGAAVASPKRLEILELLAQGEKSVETLAREATIDVRLASAHLRVLRTARLVDVRREGKSRVYRLGGAEVSALWVALRSVAESRLAELQMAMSQLFSGPERLTLESSRSLLEKVRAGEAVLIDVRPEPEFRTAHLPGARSVPLDELEKRIKDLPDDKEIIAYCRGPFCIMSDAAVTLLTRHGLRARKIAEGVAEWQAAGLPLDVAAA
ncbi:ArsR family transcriptional regulator (plasmid) [Burkholderia thailandensis]|uniref:ArsR/SmtB family transcription factor n=1 Tax=Burkholderia thailandensis TaxID=57975 RepID=UPI00192DE323|nr:metalloregulator ArsR/SmtB family transcription factor [Burkholderia thailandensis]MBS2132231.1 ArsR family transcriptional regulator [Burkholderia thailandensis]QRA15325.1 ArsR family transcriptional regulator [Burkholderia thailandensis]